MDLKIFNGILIKIVVFCVQCESMVAVERRLKELGIRYVQRREEEGGIHVDQIFFHDPDGFMIEVCTCDNLPVIPLVTQLDAACARQAARAAARRQKQFSSGTESGRARRESCEVSVAS